MSEPIQTICVNLEGLFQNAEPFQGIFRVKLNQPAVCKETKICILPREWEAIPFKSDGCCQIKVVPNSVLGEGSYYEFEILYNANTGAYVYDLYGKKKCLLKGLFVAPDYDCNLVDITVIEPTKPEPIEAAKAYASEAKEAAMRAEEAAEKVKVEIEAEIDAMIAEEAAAREAAIKAHTGRIDNPHGVTPTQIGAASAEAVEGLNNAINAVDKKVVANTAAIEANTTAINTEKTARNEAIEAEAKTRGDKDAELEAAISANAKSITDETTARAAAISALQGAVDTKANAADLSALQTTVAGKANADHTHEIANVNGLQGALDGKASDTDLQSHINTATANPHGVQASDIFTEGLDFTSKELKKLQFNFNPDYTTDDAFILGEYDPYSGYSSKNGIFKCYMEGMFEKQATFNNQSNFYNYLYSYYCLYAYSYAYFYAYSYFYSPAYFYGGLYAADNNTGTEYEVAQELTALRDRVAALESQLANLTALAASDTTQAKMRTTLSGIGNSIDTETENTTARQLTAEELAAIQQAKDEAANKKPSTETQE